MSHSAFLDRSLKPDDAEIFKTLGPKVKYWKELKQHIEETYGPVTEEWKFYSKKSGWTLKVLLKKRNLFFFIPLKDHFLMTFIFGDKAVSAVEKSGLPKSIIDTLLNAKKYMEGRGLQIGVKGPGDLKNAKKLVEIKVNN